MKSKFLNQLGPKDLKVWFEQESLNPFLIDVREADEISFAPFTYQVLHLPLSRFSEWSINLTEKLPLDQDIVVICHSGIRSANFGDWILSQEWGYKVWNLTGGIDAWSLFVDTNIPRY